VKSGADVLFSNALTMPASFIAVLEFALLAATSIFFLVDPFAVIPLFLAMTSDSPQQEKKDMARRAAYTCAIVLTAFAIAGSLIFKMFGITLPAFKIAGGIILLKIGLDMLEGKQSRATPTRALFRWACRCWRGRARFPR
jgi:multiple antibiotic resistance protein